jgi:cysteine desulfurase
MGMPDIAAASGAGCSSATLEPSYVLAAMGVPERVGHGTVRFSLGRTTTDDDVARAAARVVETVERLRSLGG